MKKTKSAQLKKVYCNNCRYLTNTNRCLHPNNIEEHGNWETTWKAQKELPQYKNLHNDCKDFENFKNVFDKFIRMLWRITSST